MSHFTPGMYPTAFPDGFPLCCVQCNCFCITVSQLKGMLIHSSVPDSQPVSFTNFLLIREDIWMMTTGSSQADEH